MDILARTKGEKTKMHIIDKAFSVFLRKGYHAATMDDILQAAKISKGSFYYHFKGKEDVYKQAIAKHFDLQNKVFASLDLYYLSPQNAFVKVFKAYKDYLEELAQEHNATYLDFQRLYYEAISLFDEFRDVVKNEYKKILNIVADTFEIEDKEKSQLLASKYLALFDGLIYRLSLFPDMDEKMVEEIINLDKDF